MITYDTLAEMLANADGRMSLLSPGDKVQVAAGAVYQVQAPTSVPAEIDDRDGYHLITAIDDVKVRSIYHFACPTHFGAVGDGITDDTWAAQMALIYTADCGRFAPTGRRTYLISAPLTYFERARHEGNKSVTFLAAEDANMAAVFVPRTWATANGDEMFDLRNVSRYRPEFFGFRILCNGENDGADSAIILTSSEGRVERMEIRDARKYGVRLTPRNQHGNVFADGGVPVDGVNLLQNFIISNRITTGVGEGGILTEDVSSMTTDGWCVGNSITGGSKWAIYIEAAQGWKITGNQTSTTLSGIGLGKINCTTLADNVVHGFGNTTTPGLRVGYQLGGLTLGNATLVSSNNAATGRGNESANADPDTLTVGVRFWGSGTTSDRAAVVVRGFALTFENFSGLEGKAIAVQQPANSVNDFSGIIDGITVTSDEDAFGLPGYCRTLFAAPASSQVRLGRCINGGMAIGDELGGLSPNTANGLSAMNLVGSVLDQPSIGGASTVVPIKFLDVIISEVTVSLELDLSVRAVPANSPGYAWRRIGATVDVRDYSTATAPGVVLTPVAGSERSGTHNSGVRNISDLELSAVATQNANGSTTLSLFASVTAGGSSIGSGAPVNLEYRVEGFGRGLIGYVEA